MVNQTDNGISQRGGIALRDYTQRNGSLSVRSIQQRGIKFNAETVGHALVFASLGLGLMEVLMPKRIQRFVGIRRGDYSGLIRLAGIREMMHAMLIFMEARPFAGVWSRVIGDAMDLGLLGAAFTAPRVKKDRLGMATGAIAGITALDALTAAQIKRRRAEAERLSTISQDELDGHTKGGGFHVMRSITINRSPEELYRFWRNFENLPQFMIHLQMVRVIDDRRSRWVTKAPAGSHVEWDAEITDDRPNQLIAWRSMPGADVENSGVVRFEPGPAGRGTLVRVEVDYRPPVGNAGRLVAKLFGEEPTQQIMGDLGRFKQVMETGEVLVSDSSPQGLGTKTQRPAQPLPGGNDGEMLREGTRPDVSTFVVQD